MSGKRKEFLSRLLRISEINEELVELNDKSAKQPAFTRRIKLFQMGQCQINLPQQKQPQPHPSRILMLSSPPTSQQTCRSKTINCEDKSESSPSPDRIPKGMDPKQFKIYLQRKKSLVTVQSKGQPTLNFVSQIHCAPRTVTSAQNRRPNTGGTRKSIGHSSIKSVSRTPLDKEMWGDSADLAKEGVRIQGRYFKTSGQFGHATQARTVEEQKKAKLLLMKQINKNYGKPFIPPPKISAKAYLICEITPQQSLKVIVSHNSKNTQEVASLTKIMTCLLTLEFCQTHSYDIYANLVKIGKYQSHIGGTTAELRQGQIYTVAQLLHGLMLPSGNDASLALAVWVGRRLLAIDRNLNRDQMALLLMNEGCTSLNPSIFPGEKLKKSECYGRFIREMNEKARFLKMNKTQYANSHGLANPNNRSTAYDIALLSQYAMRNQTFRQIVTTAKYQATIQVVPVLEETSPEEQTRSAEQSDEENEVEQNVQDEGVSPVRPVTCRQRQSRPASPAKQSNQPYQMVVGWQNTHKLLLSKPNEYIGIKTGFTNSAGSCLSSCLRIDGRMFIIVVLCCAKIHLRFKETEVLKRWLYKHQNLVKRVKRSQSKFTPSDQDEEDEEQFEEDKNEERNGDYQD